MRKKTSITAANRRRAEDFFSRLGDVFEHKFDGFPASVTQVKGQTPVDGSDMFADVDINALIEELANQTTAPVSGAVPCPDSGEEGSPCKEPYCDVIQDTFSRASASGFGTTDTGHIWDSPVGITPTFASAVTGFAGVLQEDDGFINTGTVGDETTHIGAQELDLDGEGELFVPLTIRFDMWYTGNWNSTYVYNGVPLNFADPDGTCWAPGFAETAVRTNPGGWGGPALRDLFSVRIRASVPILRWNIYNSNGSLWLARWSTSSTSGVQYLPPLQVATQLEANEVLSVKIHLDSSQAYMRIWKEGDSEPSYWMATTAVASPWGDALVSLVSQASAYQSTQPPFTVYVDNFCMGREEFDCSPESGSTYYSNLTSDDGIEWSFPVPIRYVLDVTIDDSAGVEGLDYSVSGSVLTTTSPATTVSARYVAA